MSENNQTREKLLAEIGNKNPTLSCPSAALCGGGRLWKRSLMHLEFPVASF